MCVLLAAVSVRPGVDAASGETRLWCAIRPDGSVRVHADIERAAGQETIDLDSLAGALAAGIGTGRTRAQAAVGRFSWSSAEPHPGRRDAWRLSVRIDPAPLASVFADLGFETLVLLLEIPWAGSASAPGRRVMLDPHEGRALKEVRIHLRAAPPPPFMIDVGYSAEDALRLLLVFTPCVIVPFGAGAAFYLRARRRLARGASEAWFGAVQAIKGWAWLAWLGWAGTIAFTEVEHLLDFAGPPGTRLAGGAIVVLVVLAGPGYAFCSYWLARDLALRANAEPFDRSVLRRIQFFGVAETIVPIGLVVAALSLIEWLGARGAVLLLFLAWLVRMLAADRSARAVGVAAHGLTSGALRDRAFELARKAGVTLRHVYLLGAEKMRHVNAVAFAGDGIAVTDGLLRDMSRHEVDTVVAHEIAHLRGRHRWKLAAGGGAGALIGGLGAGILLDALDPLPGTGEVLLVVVAIEAALLSVRFFSRRLELAADREAARLTGDVETAIRMEARLARAAGQPFEWGPIAKLLSTHPPAKQRIGALARRHGVPDSTVRALTDVSAPAEDRYDEEAAIATGGLVFSSPFRTRVALRRRFLVAVATAIPAGASVSLAGALGFGGPAGIATLVLGAAAAISAYLAIENAAWTWPLSRLEMRVRRKFSAEGLAQRGVFAGFAPGRAARLYEVFADWDAGLLDADGERLLFTGERVRFAISRASIVSVARGARPPGWFRAPRIVIAWRDRDGIAGEASFAPLACRTLRAGARATDRLAAELASWLAAPVAPGPEQESATPRIGEVTGLKPRDVVPIRMFPVEFVKWLPLGFGALVVFGFPIADPLPAAAGVASIGLLVTILRHLPFWRERRLRETHEPPR